MAALSFKQFFFAWMRRAFTQSLGPIDLWAGLLAAALGVIDHYWPAGQLMSSLGWQVPVFALAAVMVVRLLLAPYWMAKDDAAKIARLEARNSVPDIKIESISRAQIFEKQPNEKTDGGIFIVFSMCKVINRDEKRASLEFQLRVNLGQNAAGQKGFIAFAQIPKWIVEREALFQAGAHQLPSVLNIEPHTTEQGYLAFFQPYPLDGATEMAMQFGGNKKDTPLIEVVERYDFDMLVAEHISGTDHEIPASKYINYSLRPEKPMESPRVA